MRRFLGLIVITALALSFAPDTDARSIAGSSLEQRPAVTRTRSRTIDPEAFKSSSASMDLAVSDPRTAHADAERRLVKLGAEILSSSASDGSAQLSVRIGEGQLQSAMEALRSLPGHVRSESRSQNDFTMSAQISVDRLHRLDLADAALRRAMKSASDDDAIDGLTLLCEMAEIDRQGNESQLDSLRQQSERAQLHVSFSQLQ